MSETTIAAIATPLGTSGVGMIRMSGPRALGIAAGMIRPLGKKDIGKMPGYTGLFGRVFDEEGDVDDAVLFVYRAPNSYTGEDTAEICCHGGPYLLERVLRRCCACGAVPAGPGEFTRRAYLAGKLSLTQAEAVAALIESSGSQAAAAALAARDGAVSRGVEEIRARLVGLSAPLAVWADYPDEERPEVSAARLERELSEVVGALEALLARYESGLLARDGVAAAIIGRPNVGKSTIMNLLTGEETSIVTDAAGTTRDVVEGRMHLGGITLRLWDTAGIRASEDAAEAEGVRRARKRLEGAQLILIVLDGASQLSEEDEALLREINGRPALAVFNKRDLGAALEEGRVAPYVRGVVRMSALTGAGARELTEAVRRVLRLDQLDPGAAVLQGGRQAACAREARRQAGDALEALRAGMTLDAVHVCIDEAIEALAALTGERADEAVVNEVFSRFCVGK